MENDDHWNERTAARRQFFEALNKVQGLLEPITKDATNPHFKSKYASLAAVNQSIMGPLSEAGFVLLSGGDCVGGKPYLITKLIHKNGHEESFHYPLIEKTDNPQHMASSVTYARRYSICALLNLSVEDDDGEKATHAPASTEKHYQAPENKPAAASTGTGNISEPQAKRFFAIAMGAGKTKDDIADYLASVFNVKRSTELSRAYYDQACEWAAEKSKTEAEIESVPF